MSSPEMRRGRLQSLYRYMPDQTYNWDKGLGSFKGTHGIDSRTLKIPAGWIKRPLRRKLRGFNIPTVRGQTLVDRDEFDLLEPLTMRGEFFPRIFSCSKCGAVQGSDESPNRVRCPRDGERMSQLAFVEYHKCGHIGGLMPPTCANRCRAPMLLLGPTGAPRSAQDRRFSEWKWQCSNCRLSPRGVYRGCTGCGRGQVRVAPADAGPVYYAQDITVVNPPSEADWDVLSADGAYIAAIAQGLGVLEPGITALRAAVNDSGGVADEVVREKLMQEYNLDPDQPDDAQLIEQLLSRRSESDHPDWRSSVDELGLEEEDLEEVGTECVELSLILSADGKTAEKRPLSVADLASEAGDGPLRAKYETSYPRALDRFGFTDVMLIREFPIARIVAGYTREDPKPNLADPNQSPRFHFFDGEAGRKAMYGQRSTTEALFFKVDPQRILEWLKASGLVGDIDGSAISWLYTSLQPVTSIFEPPEDRITAAVLGLLHSMAHRIIMSLSERSGLKADSLTEKIMPYNGSFLIYPGGRSDFILGGLEHVFRNHLDECLNSANDEKRCVFDPPCISRSGACAVCMYLSEVSCERFNSALSRHFLWGGYGAGVDWKGFWNVPVASR